MFEVSGYRGFHIQLSKDDIRRMTHLRGLPIEESDLDEVRHRINALSDAMKLLDDHELTTVDPLPLLVHDQETQYE